MTEFVKHGAEYDNGYSKYHEYIHKLSHNMDHLVANSKPLLHITVKPVYKDRSRDQKKAVFIDRWSLYAGSRFYMLDFNSDCIIKF